MKAWRRRVLAALAVLLAACGPQLAADEERYLAQGYTRLSAHAYVRETDGGGPASPSPRRVNWARRPS